MSYNENQILLKMNGLDSDQKNDVIRLIEKLTHSRKGNYRRRAMTEIKDALSGKS